jgi:hypothetical protein
MTCVGCGRPMPPPAPHAGRRVFCSKDCPNTLWRPGLMVGTHTPGGSDEPARPVMLVQRAPDDDGWLAISVDGVVYNIFDSIARLYHTTGQNRRPACVQAAQHPSEWFGMRRVRLNLKPIAGR